MANVLQSLFRLSRSVNRHYHRIWGSEFSCSNRTHERQSQAERASAVPKNKVFRMFGLFTQTCQNGTLCLFCKKSSSCIASSKVNGLAGAGASLGRLVHPTSLPFFILWGHINNVVYIPPLATIYSDLPTDKSCGNDLFSKVRAESEYSYICSAKNTCPHPTSAKIMSKKNFSLEPTKLCLVFIPTSFWL